MNAFNGCSSLNEVYYCGISSITTASFGNPPCISEIYVTTEYPNEKFCNINVNKSLNDACKDPDTPTISTESQAPTATAESKTSTVSTESQTSTATAEQKADTDSTNSSGKRRIGKSAIIAIIVVCAIVVIIIVVVVVWMKCKNKDDEKENEMNDILNETGELESRKISSSTIVKDNEINKGVNNNTVQMGVNGNKLFDCHDNKNNVEKQNNELKGFVNIVCLII